MANAQYPDGRNEKIATGATPEKATLAALQALMGGAEKVTIYTEPHAFAGNARRCATCSMLPDDKVHGAGSGERPL